MEKQGELHIADPQNRRSSASDSFCACDDKSEQEKEVAAEGFASRRSSSRNRPGALLQPARSYLSCLSDDRDCDTGPATNASTEYEMYKVGWDGEDDPMNPRNMNKARKWLITFTMALCSMCVTCTSSLYTTTYNQIDEDFGTSRIVSTLGLSLFVFGLGLSPLVLGPLSEFYGRRPIYIGAFVFFTIWLVPCAVAPNIETMLVARFFDGLSGSAFLSVAGGTIGDMFLPQDLQKPMMVYTAAPFIGPGLGPVVGGFVNSFLPWSWSFWILLIWSGLMLAAITFFIPETYHPVVRWPFLRGSKNHNYTDIYSSSGTKLASCAKRLAKKSTKPPSRS